MHKKKPLIYKFKISFFTKIFLFIFLIISFIFLVSIFSTQFYINYQEKKIEERFEKSLYLLSLYMDDLLYDTNSKAYSFVWNESLDDIRKSKNPLVDFKNGHKNLGIQIYSLIHSVYYINIKKRTVTGRDFTISIQDFFSYHYPEIKSMNFNESSFLPFFNRSISTKFKLNELQTTNVIPYYIHDQGDSNNILLINLNQEKINLLLSDFIMTPNSLILMMDSKGYILSLTAFIANDYFSKQYMILSEKYYNTIKEKFKNYYPVINNQYLIKKIKLCKPFRHKINNEKILMTSIESKKSVNQKIYYIAAVPYKDLYIQSIPIGTLAFFISILTLLLSLLLSFFISKKLYSPIKNLLSLFSPIFGIQAKNSKDEFSYISQKINNLLKDKVELSKNLTMALPMVAENYIFKALNENIAFVEDELKKFLESNNISFKYPNFLVSIVRLNFNNDFYQNFNREQQLEVINQTYKLFKNAFTDPQNVYILTIAKNELCIIFNLPIDKSNDYILKSLNNILKIFESKENYFEFYTGVGRIHYGFTGLRESYKEAYQAISTISPFGMEKIKIYEEILANLDQYYYNINEENQLLNFLLSGFENEAIELVKSILKKNTDKKISIDKQKDLYMRIFYTCIRVLNRKDISHKELMESEYIDISKEYNNDINIISSYLFKLIKKIAALNINIQKSKFDVSNIINFINNNYTDDISLENIAYDYKISTPHLSRLLKEALGMPFQQYINNQRVKKAKFILKNTSKGIDEISNECGFNSRFTFIRMFKKLEGISPTQYRIMEKESVY